MSDVVYTAPMLARLRAKWRRRVFRYAFRLAAGPIGKAERRHLFWLIGVCERRLEQLDHLQARSVFGLNPPAPRLLQLEERERHGT